MLPQSGKSTFVGMSKSFDKNGFYLNERSIFSVRTKSPILYNILLLLDENGFVKEGSDYSEEYYDVHIFSKGNMRVLIRKNGLENNFQTFHEIGKNDFADFVNAKTK